MQEAFLTLLSSLGATCVETGQEAEEGRGEALLFSVSVLSVSDDSLRRMVRYTTRQLSGHCDAKFDVLMPDPANDAAFVVDSPVLGAGKRTNKNGQQDGLLTYIDNRVHTLCPVL